MDETTGTYVLVIPPSQGSPMEAVGMFSSAEAAEQWAVEHRLISWTACPLLSRKMAHIVATTPGCRWSGG